MPRTEADPAYIMTITIIEIIHHADVLKNIVKVLSADNQIRLILLVSERVYQEAQLDNLHSPNVDVFVKSRADKLDRFLADHQVHIDQSDIVYINTIEKYFRILSQHHFNKPLIIRIHNVHADLAPWRHLNWSTGNFANTLSYLLRRLIIQRRQLYKNRLLGKASGLMFSNSAITEYVKENQFHFYEKTLPPSLPFCYLDNFVNQPVTKSDDNTVSMAIPGSIDNQRKDYQEVFTALSNAKHLFQKQVELRLLGKPKGDAGKVIVDRFMGLASNKLKITYNKEFIPQDKFQEMFEEVDFLIAPIKVHTQYRIFHEIYGKSKMSGIENDIITQHKPAIVVDSYRMPQELRNVTSSYRTTEQLTDLIVDWVNNSTFLEHSLHFKDLDFYRAENIQRNFIHLCKGLISQNYH